MFLGLFLHAEHDSDILFSLFRTRNSNIFEKMFEFYLFLISVALTGLELDKLWILFNSAHNFLQLIIQLHICEI